MAQRQAGERREWLLGRLRLRRASRARRDRGPSLGAQWKQRKAGAGARVRGCISWELWENVWWPRNVGATYLCVIRLAPLPQLQLAQAGDGTSCSQGHCCTWAGLPGLLLSGPGGAVSGRGSHQAGGAVGTSGSSQ